MRSCFGSQTLRVKQASRALSADSGALMGAFLWDRLHLPVANSMCRALGISHSEMLYRCYLLGAYSNAGRYDDY